MAAAAGRKAEGAHARLQRHDERAARRREGEEGCQKGMHVCTHVDVRTRARRCEGQAMRGQAMRAPALEADFFLLLYIGCVTNCLRCRAM